MLIKDLLGESQHELDNCASVKEPQMKSVEAYMKRIQDPSYTPGKASLELEYKETEDHTKTEIPYKQDQLNDPRQ